MGPREGEKKKQYMSTPCEDHVTAQSFCDHRASCPSTLTWLDRFLHCETLFEAFLFLLLVNRVLIGSSLKGKLSSSLKIEVIGSARV